MNSIYAGVTGMVAHQMAVDVIANNIANVNTVAYKAARVTFEETLNQTLSAGNSSGVNPMQIGKGVGIGTIDNMMGQGNMRPTSRNLDLAIVGDGFFVIGEAAEQRFTRDGVFQLDSDNRLIMASNGMRVVGWTADVVSGAIDTEAPPSADIYVPVNTYYAVPTTEVTLGGNLDATTAIGGTVDTAYYVYDSYGTQHTVTVTFTKTAAATWAWAAASPDGALAIVAPGTNTLTFDEHGNMTSSAVNVDFTLTTPNGVTSPMRMSMDFSAVKELDGSNSVMANSQNGLPMGKLDNFTIEADGQIIGSFSNGASRVLGQIAIARFSNPSGLRKDGYNLWTVSASSGEPVVNTLADGSSQVRSGYLEMSNVDLATEFANLIIIQRGFQANSRSITTSDEMMQELLSLKR
jgi:flagellar hook protein FlgE